MILPELAKVSPITSAWILGFRKAGGTMNIRPLGQNFESVFYDGQQSKRQEGQVKLTQNCIQIELPTYCLVWSYEDAKLVSDGFYGGPARVEHPGYPAAALIVADAHFSAALAQHSPKFGGLPWWDQRLTGWQSMLRSAVLVAILGSSFYYFGIGLIAEAGVRLAPRSMEEKMGASIVQLIARPELVCPQSEATKLLSIVEQRLFAADLSGYNFKVTYARLDMVNAFAAPGGQIVVSDYLVRLTDSPEEYAGVLAHEMMHVRNRDSLRSLARNLGGSAILSLLSVDPASNPIFVSESMNVLNLSYSRSAEEDADAGGLFLLREAKMDQEGLSKFLGRLTERRRNGGQVPTYLSTHPETETRISRLQKLKQGRGAVEPVLSAEEWKRAKSVCLAEEPK